VRGTAGARDDDRRALERPAHRPFHARAEPRAIAVEPDESPLGVLRHVVHGTDAVRLGLRDVTQCGDDPLVRRGDPETEPLVRPCRRHRGFHLVGFELAQLVSGVDPGRGEGGVVHDLRMAAPEGLAQQRDEAGHRRHGLGGRRTGPAVSGNTTLGMISSTHSWSWPGSGVIVCRKKYSTPASTRAWSEAMISSGVPNR
jgi:hypothetical protein